MGKKSTFLSACLQHPISLPGKEVPNSKSAIAQRSNIGGNVFRQSAKHTHNLNL